MMDFSAGADDLDDGRVPDERGITMDHLGDRVYVVRVETRAGSCPR